MAKFACGVGSAHNKVTYLGSQNFLGMCITMRAQVLYNFVQPNEDQSGLKKPWLSSSWAFGLGEIATTCTVSFG
jgi:hypothetical protein